MNSTRWPSLVKLSLVVLLLLGVALFYQRLGEADLWSSHEARAAMNARSILQGEPLPHLEDGEIELQKPPGFYWLVAFTAWFRGGDVDALAVRIPTALSATFIILALCFFFRRFERPLAGVLAGLVLVCNIHFPWLARIGRIDAPLALTVTLSSLAFYLASASTRPRRWLFLAYLFCALGVPLKGPIGVVLPGAILTAHLFATGRWPAIWEGQGWWHLLRNLGVLPGLLLIVVICTPVFLWLESASNGQFFREFFWYHNLQRGLGGSRLRAHPWWLYGPYLALYLLPWTPLLLIPLLKKASGGRQPPVSSGGSPSPTVCTATPDPLARFGLAWTVGSLLILSAARFKRADYLLPVYPGVAIYLGCVLERILASRAQRFAFPALLTTCTAMLIGWFVYLQVQFPLENARRDVRAFAAKVRQYVPEPEEVVFFRAEAHALAFHVGRPLTRIVQWHELHHRLRTGTQYLVVDEEAIEETRYSTRGYTFTEVSRRGPCVLMRVQPEEANRHAGLSQVTTRRK